MKGFFVRDGMEKLGGTAVGQLDLHRVTGERSRKRSYNRSKEAGKWARIWHAKLSKFHRGVNDQNWNFRSQQVIGSL